LQRTKQISEAKEINRSLLEERARDQFPSLSEAECKLLRAVREGKVADCRTSETPNASEDDPSRANEWSDERTIRAPLLRWLCVDRGAKESVDPYGIRISFARLSGRLDLSFVTLPFPLACNGCWWPEGIELTGAALPGLRLEKTWVGPLEASGGQSGPGRSVIVADRAVIKGLVVLRNGFHAQGRVRLFGIEIGGNLECGSSSFIAPGDIALNLERATVAGGVYLRNGFAAEGEVRLLRANFGSLECDGGSFKNAGNTALNAEGAKIRGPVLLRNGFAAEGEVRVMDAEIDGALDCHGGSFKNSGKTALQASGVKPADRSCFAMVLPPTARFCCFVPKRVAISHARMAGSSIPMEERLVRREQRLAAPFCFVRALPQTARFGFWTRKAEVHLIAVGVSSTTREIWRSV
jgi:hypothetical protein